MSKILIIGGAGFIGLNIAKKLNQNKKNKITIIDNFFRGKMDDQMQNFTEKNKIPVISADLTEFNSFNKLDTDYDYVYMLASVVGVEYTNKMPDKLIRINSLLILNTLEWIKNTNCKKILFSSTSECYAGTIETFDYKIPTSEDVPLCIDNIHNPRFTYAVTKMMGESAFINYSKVYGFESVIVRYHNVYGPRMGFKHVIPQVVQRFLKDEDPFRIFGYNQTRSFNYIDDAVNGTILAMESNQSNQQIFHIGDMKSEITIEMLVKYIAELMDFRGEFKIEQAHDGSVSRRCPDISKAIKILNYNPKMNWKDGVKNTVKWYVNYIREGKEIFE